MEENKKESNSGCIIMIVLFVVISIICNIATTSKEDFAETGEIIMGLAGLGIGFWVLSSFFGSNSSEKSTDKKDTSLWKVCLAIIGAILVVGLIFSVMTSSFEINAFVGVIAMIALMIGIGICVGNSIDD